jgi:hypothetical protein
MTKLFTALILLMPLSLFSKQESGMKTYLAQVDADTGIQVSVLVNGILAVERDGSDWISGGAQINPFMKPGKNIIEINAKALPTLKQEPRLRIVIQSREQESPLFSLDHLTDKINLPVMKTLELNLPDFPLTDLWKAENPGEKAEAQIYEFLKIQRANLISLVEKKDVKGLIKTLEVATRINSKALGMEFPVEMVEKHLKESLGTGPIKIIPPPEISPEAITIVNLGSFLYKVSRKDKEPLLLIRTGEKESRFNYGARFPILGKINGKWEILNEAD